MIVAILSFVLATLAVLALAALVRKYDAHWGCLGCLGCSGILLIVTIIPVVSVIVSIILRARFSWWVPVSIFVALVVFITIAVLARNFDRLVIAARRNMRRNNQ